MPQSYDFVAIDFETATIYLGSACQLGIVAVTQDGEIELFSSDLRPPDNLYDKQNTLIHGITPDRTEHAPTLDTLWPEIERFFDEHTLLIAHNAHFDFSVLCLSTTRELPNLAYLDTMDMAKPLMGKRASLDACVEALGIPLDQHHDALSDAKAAAQIAYSIRCASGALSMWEYAALYYPGVIGSLSDLTPQRYLTNKGRNHEQTKNRVHYVGAASVASFPQNKEANPEGLLYGKSIVFTGEICISREKAFQIAAECGAIVKSSVSRKTDYLVVGKQDSLLVGADGISTKQRKAQELNSTGKAEIKIINEDEFFRLTGLNPVSS